MHCCPCASYFDFNTTVRLQAFDQCLGLLVAFACIAGYRIGFAFAIDEDLISCYALFLHQIGLDRLSATQREFLVVGVRANTISITDGNYGVVLYTLEFTYPVIQGLFATRFPLGLIEFEQLSSS